MCREMEEIYNWGIEHERKNTELEKQKAEQEKQKAEQEKQNIARLTTVLLENGYVEECLRAANDEAYQRQLMKEWNIASVKKESERINVKHIGSFFEKNGKNEIRKRDQEIVRLI